MIVQLTGTLVEVLPSRVVLDVGGVGYELGVSSTTAASLPHAGEAGVTVLTRMIVREDAMELYGFATQEELNLFQQLISVSGVGPKAALAVLSSTSPQNLALSIVTGDEKALTAAPGIGKKIAQRIILELKDKLAKDQSSFSAQSGGAIPVVLPGDKGGEAAAALAVLGYGSQEIGLALKGIDMDALPLEEIIRQALKKMVR